MIVDTRLLELLPVAVYVTDADGRITFYNDAAAEAAGVIGPNRSEPVVRFLAALLAGWHPHAARRMPNGRLVEGRSAGSRVEAIAERPDGTRVSFRPYPTPLRDASGKLIGAINLLLGIEDRVHADLELYDRQQSSFRPTMPSSARRSRAGSLHGTPVQRIFGYTAEEMIGQPIIRIVPPELHEE